jgi:hypothetical protein
MIAWAKVWSIVGEAVAVQPFLTTLSCTRYELHGLAPIPFAEHWDRQGVFEALQQISQLDALFQRLSMILR